MRHLVKHYQDGRLQAGHVNDSERDAKLVLQVLADQISAFTKLQPDALLAYHHLTTRGEAAAGFDALFQYLRGASAPAVAKAVAAIRRLLTGLVCNHRLEQTLGRLTDPRPMRCHGFRSLAGTLSCRHGCGCSSAKLR